MSNQNFEPVLDFHTHIFPPQVAAKAVASIGDFYELPMLARGKSGGTASGLLAAIKAAGISHCVIFSTATRIEQVDSINQFMLECQQAEPIFTAFGTLHPSMPDADVIKEINRIEKTGLHGIKLHPDFQRVAADSHFVIHATRLMAGRLPLLIHAGDPRKDYSRPARIRALALACPETTIIAAHLGGWSQWQEAADLLSGIPNLYVDTSSSLALLSNAEAVGLIRRFNMQHVVFGSDYPMWQPDEELKRFHELPLTAQEKRAILWENGCKLLGMDVSSN